MMNRSDQLIAYIEGGRQEAIKALMANGCNPNRAASWGELPIMVAILVGNMEAIKILIEYQVDLSCYYNNKTPLQYAISIDCFDIARIIAQVDGVQIDQRLNDQELTPFMMAADKNRVDLMHDLIKVGSDIHCLDRYGCTALDHVGDPILKIRFCC